MKSWSYSALNAFETCARRYYHYNIIKDVTEPESEALREGHRLHQVFQDRLIQDKPLPLGFGQHEAMLRKILAAPGELSVEVKLAITDSFKATSWRSPMAWCRTVIDCCKIDGGMGRLFDWKSGRVGDDETQLMIMAAAMFAHQPKLHTVKAGLVFVNYDQAFSRTYERGELPVVWNKLLPRVKKLLAATQFEPTPSGLCKKYCAVESCEFHGVGGR